MKIIAITGRIATGKSTILQQFRFLGASTFSSDEMVNNIYNNDLEFFSKITELFPKAIEKEKINKKKLSDLVFNDYKALRELENLIYPKLNIKRKEIIKSGLLNNNKLLIFEIPLLFEKKINNIFNLIISTTCYNQIQKQRYLKRKNTSLEKFNFINNEYIKDSERFKNSDFTINTGNGLHHSLASIKKIIKYYERNYFRHRNHRFKDRRWA